jgi:hypothetical protein
LNTPTAITRPSVTAAATPSASRIGPVTPGTLFARPRAVHVPNATIPARSATTSQRLSVSKIAWIT